MVVAKAKGKTLFRKTGKGLNICIIRSFTARSFLSSAGGFHLMPGPKARCTCCLWLEQLYYINTRFAVCQ